MNGLSKALAAELKMMAVIAKPSERLSHASRPSAFRLLPLDLHPLHFLFIISDL
jgi:hypothetical protein